MVGGRDAEYGKGVVSVPPDLFIPLSVMTALVHSMRGNLETVFSSLLHN